MLNRLHRRTRPRFGDLRDIYPTFDAIFVVTVISDAIRRRVHHYKVDGTPLARLNEILGALASDGEVLMDTKGSIEDTRH